LGGYPTIARGLATGEMLVQVAPPPR